MPTSCATSAVAAALTASLLLSACVVVPTTMDGYDSSCGLVTHHMALTTVQVGNINNCSGKQDCLVMMSALGLTAASAIVSGSIVLIGNVVYWAEQRVGCMATNPPAAPVPTPL